MTWGGDPETSGKADMLDGDSYALRSFLSWAVSNGSWLFFTSPKGYIGLADPCSRYSDSIAIVLGCPLPLVIRKIGDCNTYKLVGEAYVQGFMNGEAIQMMVDSKMIVKTIDIV